ncbi:MAG: galactose mutarotase [Duncaniella sp.]|nr:galactose mutarotase [Duncaniella sp.]
MSITVTTHPTAEGEIKHFTITNRHGATATLSNLGACIVSIIVPDREGVMADVVLGYDRPESWMADGPCMGKVPGRYANRIARGHFTLDGKEYTLAINNGPNALHGGPTGFQNRLWQAHAEGDDTVVMTYSATDGEEGYPGRLSVTAIYTWSDKNELTLRLKAETDAPTVVNLTNHAYFNMDGEDSGTVLDHEMQLNASHWLPTDETQIPTGEIAPVAGTPMDFTAPKQIGRDIHEDFEALKIGKGYDHCWVIDGYMKGQLKEVARLRGPKSGRLLTVSTTQPGVQVYTGNWLEGCPQSISGHPYHDYDGVAIECQGFPDAPNKPSFPSQTLLPGEQFDETIVFSFS